MILTKLLLGIAIFLIGFGIPTTIISFRTALTLNGPVKGLVWWAILSLGFALLGSILFFN